MGRTIEIPVYLFMIITTSGRKYTYSITVNMSKEALRKDQVTVRLRQVKTFGHVDMVKIT